MDIEEGPGGLSATGIIAYELAPNYFCEECGRPKGNRVLMGAPSGCKTCDEAITAHRCTGRPDLGSLAPGESWECPDCGSTWTASEEEDTCGECGRSGMVKAWTAMVGDRMDTAPRRVPVVWTPFRNALARLAEAASPPDWSPFWQPGRAPLERPRECYRLPSGAPVHVRPGCRCAR